MKRHTEQGYVCLNSTGEVIGVGLDTIGATADACFRLNVSTRAWPDMCQHRGYRCVPAKITASFDPKAQR